MIKTEAEYREIKKQLRESKEYLQQQRDDLENSGLQREQVWMAMAPALSYYQRLREEAAQYLNARLD